MRQIVHDLLQGRILLPDDVIELCRVHPGVLQLLERTAGVDRLVLPGVADKNDPVVLTKAIEELAGLLRADETRLVNYVQLREYFDDGHAPDKTFIVVDDAVRVPTLDAPAGSLLIWGTPWSNRFLNWAFMKDPNELEPVYAAIPDDVDILVSHQPPYGYGDQVPTAGGRVDHLGSRELLAAIRRAKPRLVICGHVHEAHGRSEFNGTIIHNVAVVDEQYRLVHEPTIIDLRI